MRSTQFAVARATRSHAFVIAAPEHNTEMDWLDLLAPPMAKWLETNRSSTHAEAILPLNGKGLPGNL